MPFRSSPSRRDDPTWARRRARMVDEQLVRRGIDSPRVLQVMGRIPRHLFVDEALAASSYSDATLPIGDKQTLSQPYTVARMTQSLALDGSEEVLEIGTGSGYQTAVLAGLCRTVFTVERLPSLAEKARVRLRRMGILNVRFHLGDGSLGWPEPRLFDRVLVTAGAPVVPSHLLAQLRPGGVLIIPEGGRDGQRLIRLTRGAEEQAPPRREVLEACRFVPLVGDAGWSSAL